MSLSYADNPATLRVEVEERAFASAGYEVRYNDDQNLSGNVDGELRNLLGRGVALGLRHGEGADDQEVRGSVQVPSLIWGGDLTMSAFRIREDLSLDLRVSAGFGLRWESLGLLRVLRAS